LYYFRSTVKEPVPSTSKAAEFGTAEIKPIQSETPTEVGESIPEEREKSRKSAAAGSSRSSALRRENSTVGRNPALESQQMLSQINESQVSNWR
jgi:hypothetical protein